MPGQTRRWMEKPETVRHYLSKYIEVDKFDILRTLVTFNALMADKLARRPRAAGQRRRAHDAAVHRPGHECHGVRDA